MQILSPVYYNLNKESSRLVCKMVDRVKNKIALVTGAAQGLGKTMSELLIQEGAQVILTDINENLLEKTASELDAPFKVLDVTEPKAWQNVIAEIEKDYGKLHVLINNAGILRDKSFAKMEWSDFVTVVNVHLMGSALCAHTVFPIMKEQGYGRIIMTSSSSGLFGNFGQTNYGAAKMGVVGLMNTLKLEGAKYNIHTNSVAPTATTRMTEHLFPPEFAEKLDPKLIIPGVIFLASEKAPNGEILEVGGGVVANTYVMETMGKYFGTDENFTAEAVAEHWAEVTDTSDAKRPFQGGDVALKHLETIGKSEK